MKSLGDIILSIAPAVLFVCLGNICRSPLAEAAFGIAAEHEGLRVRVDSAGTGNWHVGDPPDPRAQEIARANGVTIDHLRARQVGPQDFVDFSHVIAMDHDNLRALEQIRPMETRARLGLLLDHAPGRTGQAVADPYYGGREGFEAAWDDVSAGAEGLVRQLMSTRDSSSQ